LSSINAVVCSLFLSDAEDDANAFAVIELRLRQAVNGTYIFVLSRKESDGSGSNYMHLGTGGTDFCSFGVGSGLRALQAISLRIICRSLTAATDSDDFFPKKTIAYSLPKKKLPLS
jgi:hypothetical protein